MLSGGLGDDTLYGLGGNDTLNGGGGTDWANYVYSVATVNVSLVTNQASGGEGIDTLISIENIAGSTLADTLFGDSNANWIRGNLGNDTINGGGGFDYADYAFALAGVTVNLSALTATGDGSDTLVSIENVSGSGFADTLLGDGGGRGVV